MASRAQYGAAQVKKGATGECGGEGAAAAVRAEACFVRIRRPATEDALDGGVHDALRGGGGDGRCVRGGVVRLSTEDLEPRRK